MNSGHPGAVSAASSQINVSLGPPRQDPVVKRRRIRVLATGFGPFHDIRVNPSWQCLRPLQGITSKTPAGREFNIECREIPVDYEAADEQLAKLHGQGHSMVGTASDDEAAFDIFFHVGVSPARSYVSIESRARKFGYDRPDVAGKSAYSDIDPKTGERRYGFVQPDLEPFDNGLEELQCKADVARIAGIMSGYMPRPMQVSNDAGLFVCEYVLYSSLANSARIGKEKQRQPRPVLFLHIPMAKEPHTWDYLSDVVLRTIALAVDEAKL